MPEQVNSRPLKRVLKDMTGGGARPIQGELKNGVRVITYSTTATPKGHELDHGVTSLKSIHRSYYLDQIKDTFHDFSSFANVRFEKVDSENANINFFFGEGMKDGVGAYSSITGEHRYIIMRENPSDFEFSLKHEIGHALGVTHPAEKEEMKRNKSASAHNAGGHPAYNKRATLMSYNLSYSDEHSNHYGPADIAAFQHHFGLPGNRSPHKVILSGSIPSTIFSKQPATLEISPNCPIPNIVLPSTRYKGVRMFGDSRLCYDTHIVNVKVAEDCDTAITMEGNLRRNRLSGGAGHDTLIPLGNKDILTGGTGADQFILANGSHNTRITDYNVKEGDTLFIADNADSVVLTSLFHKKKIIGTTVSVYDIQGVEQGSAHILKAPFSDVEKGLRLPKNTAIQLNENVPPPPPPAPLQAARMEIQKLTNGGDAAGIPLSPTHSDDIELPPLNAPPPTVLPRRSK